MYVKHSSRSLLDSLDTFVANATTIRLSVEQTQNLERREIEYAALRLHDQWTRFCRSVLIASAKGRVLDRRGSTISPSPLITRRDDPLAILKPLWSKYGTGRWTAQGPAVDVPSVAIRAADLLQVQNYVSLSGALGSTSAAALELKAYRNFVAHHTRSTATDANLGSLRARVGSTYNNSPIWLLPLAPGTVGIHIFDEWCLDLIDVATAAIT